MAIELVPYEPWHGQIMLVQEAQKHDAAVLEHDLPEGAITIIMHDIPLLIGGVTEAWPGRGVAWCLISIEAAKHMGPVTRLARQHIDNQCMRRIEMYVRSSFIEGHRWARMLGFEPECKMMDFKPHLEPEFRDEHMYVRFLPWAHQH